MTSQRTSTQVDAAIMDFMSSSKIATVCYNDGSKPYAFICFYVFMGTKMCLVFKSSDKSQHAELLSTNPMVAGTIIAPTASLTNNKGIQFEGVILANEGSHGGREYYIQYPLALAMPGSLFMLRVDHVKFTYTKAAMKHKAEWHRG